MKLVSGALLFTLVCLLVAIESDAGLVKRYSNRENYEDPETQDYGLANGLQEDRDWMANEDRANASDGVSAVNAGGSPDADFRAYAAVRPNSGKREPYGGPVANKDVPTFSGGYPAAELSVPTNDYRSDVDEKVPFDKHRARADLRPDDVSSSVAPSALGESLLAKSGSGKPTRGNDANAAARNVPNTDTGLAQVAEFDQAAPVALGESSIAERAPNVGKASENAGDTAVAEPEPAAVLETDPDQDVNSDPEPISGQPTTHPDYSDGAEAITFPEPESFAEPAPEPQPDPEPAAEPVAEEGSVLVQPVQDPMINRDHEERLQPVSLEDSMSLDAITGMGDLLFVNVPIVGAKRMIMESSLSGHLKNDASVKSSPFSSPHSLQDSGVLNTDDTFYANFYQNVVPFPSVSSLEANGSPMCSRAMLRSYIKQERGQQAFNPNEVDEGLSEALLEKMLNVADSASLAHNFHRDASTAELETQTGVKHAVDAPISPAVIDDQELVERDCDDAINVQGSSGGPESNFGGVASLERPQLHASGRQADDTRSAESEGAHSDNDDTDVIANYGGSRQHSAQRRIPPHGALHVPRLNGDAGKDDRLSAAGSRDANGKRQLGTPCATGRQVERLNGGSAVSDGEGSAEPAYRRSQGELSGAAFGQRDSGALTDIERRQVAADLPPTVAAGTAVTRGRYTNDLEGSMRFSTTFKINNLNLTGQYDTDSTSDSRSHSSSVDEEKASMDAHKDHHADKKSQRTPEQELPHPRAADQVNGEMAGGRLLDDPVTEGKPGFYDGTGRDSAHDSDNQLYSFERGFLAHRSSDGHDDVGDKQPVTALPQDTASWASDERDEPTRSYRRA